MDRAYSRILDLSLTRSQIQKLDFVRFDKIKINFPGSSGNHPCAKFFLKNLLPLRPARDLVAAGLRRRAEIKFIISNTRTSLQNALQHFG